MTDKSELEVTDRIATVPNLLSAVRLAGVPLFLFLLLGPQADGWALVILLVSGGTDWLDGKLARLLGQSSRLGRFSTRSSIACTSSARWSHSWCAASSRGGSLPS